MTQRHWLVWCGQLGWVGLLGWIGAIACASSALAQSRIVPDNTLGAESSIVRSNIQGLLREEITGGAIRGVNLFHSFREFNVDNGRAAYFQNPNASIKNIFARVTGNTHSDISGTLGTFGNAANLFLINPNGIMFGSNAVLNVGGSFVGTTANAIQFGNLGIFSASTPDIPSPLLTINPSALLFNQLSPASIKNSSIAPAGPNPAGVQVTGLRVPDGQSLLLVGGDVNVGDVNVNGGSLRAYQGHIELAGLAAPGTVGLNLVDKTLSLNVPVGVARANVSLTNGAEVNVRGANGGSIVINAHDLNLAGASKLIAGIDSRLGTPNSQAGDIEINATGSLSLSNGSYLNTNTLGQGNSGKVFVQASGAVSLDNSLIVSNVGANAVGNSGGIFITAESLSLFNGAQLQSGTSAGRRGNPGGVNINVGDRVTFTGVNQNGLHSGIDNSTVAGSVGNGGDITINAGSLTAQNGARLNTKSFRAREWGNIIINARDAVSFDGGSLAESGVFTNAAVGKGGNIHVTTGTLSLKNGSQLTANVFGQGDAGNITIDARDTVNFDSGASNVFTGVQSSNFTEGMGKAGDIRVTTGSLSLTNKSVLFASNSGIGNAGNIIINARDTITSDGSISLSTEVGPKGIGNAGDIHVNARALFFKKNSQLSASNLGQGNAGSIIINTSDTVVFDALNSNGFGSAAYTVANNGNGGDIRIITGTLSLTNGGQLSSFAPGNAGNITIDARDTVSIDGVGVGSKGVSSGVNNPLLPSMRLLENPGNTGNPGKAGNTFVTTGTLTVSNGGQLLSSTYGQGNGGNITINARDTVRFSGVGSNQNYSGAYSTVESTGVGLAGNITVNTNQMKVSDGATVNASTSGIGKGGNITFNANTFEALNGGQVVTSTAGVGNAGTINLHLKDSLTLAGTNVNFTSQRRSGIFANTDSNSTGQGGSIFIDPRQVTIRDGATISVSSNGKGDAGNITLQGGKLTLDNGGSISAQTTSSKGGNIDLPLGDILLLRRGSNISTTAGNNQAGGDGGNISINAPFIVAVPDENSDITANAFSGKGGRVEINTQGLIGTQKRSQPTPESDITASSTLGVQGVVNIYTPDQNILRNNLTQLPENIIDANRLVANSCIARRHNQSGGTFFVIGNGGLPERPGEVPISYYSTGTIRTVPHEGEKATLPTSTHSVHPWKTGDPIIAAQGIYRLVNGDLVLGRECPLADSY